MNEEEVKAYMEARAKRQESDKKPALNPDPEIEFVGLEDKVNLAFRIVGKPFELRTEPTDPQFMFYSQVMGDNGHFKNINWAANTDSSGVRDTNHPDRSWILYRIMETARSEEWDDGIGKYIPKLPNSKSYAWYAKSYRGKFPVPFYPRKLVVMNVIPRQNREWCETHKHTAILSCKLDRWQYQGKDYSYAIPGIPLNLYEYIADYAVPTLGGLDVTDVILQKRAHQKDYMVTWGKWDQPPGLKEVVVAGEISEEEKSWQKYDIDEITKPASYSKLWKCFQEHIRDVDKEHGTHYLEELRELVKSESDQDPAKKEVTPENPVDNKVPIEDDDDIPF